MTPVDFADANWISRTIRSPQLRRGLLGVHRRNRGLRRIPFQCKDGSGGNGLGSSPSVEGPSGTGRLNRRMPGKPTNVCPKSSWAWRLQRKPRPCGAREGRADRQEVRGPSDDEPAVRNARCSRSNRSPTQTSGTFRGPDVTLLPASALNKTGWTWSIRGGVLESGGPVA